MKVDLQSRVVIHTANMDWQASPSPAVWRKRLELSGLREAGRVTSLVRYQPGSQFPPHPHPDGEEILVLNGVFSDEHGDYPAGHFLLNPQGFSHAPRSERGCLLFVKLRQYPGVNRRQVFLNTNDVGWEQTHDPGVERITLYQETGYPETIRLLRFALGGVARLNEPSGLELFVLEGEVADESQAYPAESWIRYPCPALATLSSTHGCKLYLKSNHL